jgi:hypothetical protein
MHYLASLPLLIAIGYSIKNKNAYAEEESN